MYLGGVMLSVVCLPVALCVCLHSKRTHTCTFSLSLSVHVWNVVRIFVSCCVYCVFCVHIFHTDVFRSENSFASLHHTLDRMCSVRISATLVFSPFSFHYFFAKINLKHTQTIFFVSLLWMYLRLFECVLIFVSAFTRVAVFICYWNSYCLVVIVVAVEHERLFCFISRFSVCCVISFLSLCCVWFIFLCIDRKQSNLQQRHLNKLIFILRDRYIFFSCLQYVCPDKGKFISEFSAVVLQVAMIIQSQLHVRH